MFFYRFYVHRSWVQILAIIVLIDLPLSDSRIDEIELSSLVLTQSLEITRKLKAGQQPAEVAEIVSELLFNHACLKVGL